LVIVAVAGRRIDADDATPRFPLARRRTVARQIDRALKQLGATAVVSSAACGADLLALDAARKRGIEQYIVLPYRRDWFLVDSVLDRRGRWRELYETALKAAYNLVTLRQPRHSEESYRVVSDRIIDEALHLARQESPENPAANLAVLVVWEGGSRGEDDMTDYMLRRACEVGGRVAQVITLPQHAINESGAP
jgi:broad specificity phosphatase PhoE